MKSFECLVLSHLKAITDPLLDPLQFAYRDNRSVDYAVNMALHFNLQHRDSSGTYANLCNFLGTTITQDLKWEAERQLHHQKGPAEDVLPAAVHPAKDKDNDGALLHHHH